MVAQALQLIMELSQDPVTVDEVVRKLPTTRRTLERKFRNKLGRSILEEINQCHLDRAKRLLKETDLSITAVATAAGFPSLVTMCRVFQRVYKISPGEYRIRNFL